MRRVRVKTAWKESQHFISFSVLTASQRVVRHSKKVDGLMLGLGKGGNSRAVSPVRHSARRSGSSGLSKRRQDSREMTRAGDWDDAGKPAEAQPRDQGG